jgi:hypothetical protein
MDTPTSYLQWSIVALTGIFVYLAKRAIHDLDEKIADNRKEITELKERLTGFSMQLIALWYNLYGSGVVKTLPPDSRGEAKRG